MIEVEPEFLDFSAVQLGQEQVQGLSIRNVGDEVLAVSPLSIVGSSGFGLLSGASGAMLEPGERLPVVLSYTAGLEPEVSGAVGIRSSDELLPTIEVPLWGESLIPALEVNPPTVEFGAIAVGETVERPLHLRNVGEGVLEIEPLSLPLLPFVVHNNSGWTLQPGEVQTVTLSASAQTAAAYTSDLQVQSNDPAGWTNVDLHTIVAGQPIAVCSADPTEITAVFGDSSLDGTGSYDPSGLAITRYAWSLVSVPDGSAAVLDNPYASRFSFSGDVVGTYVAQLVVYNRADVASEPCEVQIEAIAGADLWVEMYWTYSNDDMDLHVLAPAGSLTSGSDCYYANCRTGLDWGVVGDILDNPYLDIDDIPGTGPENINISTPAAGEYTVYVHDYPGSVNNNPNDVTVKIYVGGALAWTDTRSVTVEGSYNPFATVSMPDGLITPL
jgi:archaellum component FlaG (FlaF/FlaG flagellin family)